MRVSSLIFRAMVLAGLLFGVGQVASSQGSSSVSVRLIDRLSTENAKAGDTFTATLAEPFVVDGRVVAQKNARVTGRVREAVETVSFDGMGVLSVACPYEPSRFEDAVKSTGNDGRLMVRDIIELIDQAMQPAPA